MIAWWHHPHEVLAHYILMLDDGDRHILEYHSFILELLTEAVIDDFAVVLRSDSCEHCTLSFRDTESFKGILDSLWDIIP